MKEKEQSSIYWLIEQIPSIDKEDLYYMEIFEQAKELHIKEIIEAYMHGDGDAYNTKEVEEDAKQYYNEKYSI